MCSLLAERGALTLNRPDKLNPLSSQTLREIAEAARWFDRHPLVKVVVVSGSGQVVLGGGRHLGGSTHRARRAPRATTRTSAGSWPTPSRR